MYVFCVCLKVVFLGCDLTVPLRMCGCVFVCCVREEKKKIEEEKKKAEEDKTKAEQEKDAAKKEVRQAQTDTQAWRRHTHQVDLYEYVNIFFVRYLFRIQFTIKIEFESLFVCSNQLEAKSNEASSKAKEAEEHKKSLDKTNKELQDARTKITALMIVQEGERRTDQRRIRGHREGGSKKKK